jgi:hypothetical protein
MLCGVRTFGKANNSSLSLSLGTWLSDVMAVVPFCWRLQYIIIFMLHKFGNRSYLFGYP